ncbi:MAG: hypothetical protein WBM06_16430, partial [Pseudolabrys sp.]
ITKNTFSGEIVSAGAWSGDNWVLLVFGITSPVGFSARVSGLFVVRFIAQGAPAALAQDQISSGFSCLTCVNVPRQRTGLS